MSYLIPLSSTTELGVVQVGSGLSVADGLISVQNIQGVQGTQGIQGNQSTQGTSGSQGIQGIQAAQGVQGIQGTGGSISSSTGTWTPTITVSSAGTVTLIVTTANYSKIGQQIICYFDATVATKTGGSNSNKLTLNGLPFTSIAGIGIVGSLITTYFALLNSNNIYITGTIAGSSNSVSLYRIADKSTTSAALTYSEIQATSQIVGTITYLSTS